MRYSRFCAVITLVLLASSNLFAQAPDSLSFQGYLTDNLGNPLDSTGVMTVFTLYKGSTAVWTETQSVSVDSGIFNVYLGAVTPMDAVAFNQPIDLGIKLVGEGSEMSPRTPLAASAYAKALPGLYTFYRDDGDAESYNVVGGAMNNVVGAGVVGATIGGGGGFRFGSAIPNSVLHDFATVGGGSTNTAGGLRSTVGGGSENTASGPNSTIAGGSINFVTGNGAAIGGGRSNEASGIFSTVPGGSENIARAQNSFAAGYSAKANHDGTFVWNDRSLVDSGNDSLLSTGPNQFLIRAAGGVGIGTNAPVSPLTIQGQGDNSEWIALKDTAGTLQYHFNYSGTGFNIAESGVADFRLFLEDGGGVGIGHGNPSHPLHVGTNGTNGNGAHVTAGGAWTAGSSREFKENLRPVQTETVLRAVLDLPLYRWRYKNSDEGDHMGPVAEDFFEAFELGEDDRYISGVDGNGVALAAIQGLYELVKDLQAENEEIRAVMERAGLE